jgi:DNA-binding LacI/PurR family transcriptional regulator
MEARATRKTTGQAATSRERMARYRQRMREKGLRPVQLWLPDTSDPAFIAKCQRQSMKLAAHDPGGDEVMAWIEQVYEWPD